MSLISLFIIAIALIVALVFAFARREASRHGTGIVEEAVGICAAAFEQASEKKKRKERVVEFLRKKGDAGNEEIRKNLGVAGRTIVKYMSELEREGRVEQVGNVGRGVVYRLKQD